MRESSTLDLKQYIRDIPDFPKPGILFRDITPLLICPTAFRECVLRMADHYRDQAIDVIVAAEARGFIFAAPLALELGTAFVPIRKPGKLPFDTHALHYDLEYGTDTLEMHIDGVSQRSTHARRRRPARHRRYRRRLLSTVGQVRRSDRRLCICHRTAGTRRCQADRQPGSVQRDPVLRAALTGSPVLRETSARALVGSLQTAQPEVRRHLG